VHGRAYGRNRHDGADRSIRADAPCDPVDARRAGAAECAAGRERRACHDRRRRVIGVERLRPLEQRLRDDDRVRRAGAVIGISALALGALHGTKPLTFAGTHALRIGLNKQLTAIEARSGFAVEPSIGHRSIAVTVKRTFE
jgi:hypothetical protein